MVKCTGGFAFVIVIWANLTLSARTQPVSQPPPDPVVSGSQPIEDSQIVARVGNEIILAGDILPAVNESIRSHADRISPEQLPEVRKVLFQRQLRRAIDTKLVYLDAKRSIPEDNFPHIQERLDEHFEESRLPQLLKATGVQTRAQLDEGLRALGSSLEQQRVAFREQALASQWQGQQKQKAREITHEEMLDYYQSHVGAFSYKSQVQWEEIMVRVRKFSSWDEAWSKINELGNLVFVHRQPIAEVAQKHSHGVTASGGGRFDWTQQGSLASQRLNEVLFSLPVGELSQVIETDQGLHIVRVVRRQNAGRTPFADAQVEIKNRIQAQRRADESDQYVSRLRDTTRVWTMFENEVGTEIGRNSQNPYLR